MGNVRISEGLGKYPTPETNVEKVGSEKELLSQLLVKEKPSCASSEKVLKISMDWKAWLSVILAILVITAYAAYLSKDTSVQDAFDTISENRSKQKKLELRIQSINEEKRKLEDEIEKAKTDLASHGIMVK